MRLVTALQIRALATVLSVAVLAGSALAGSAIAAPARLDGRIWYVRPYEYTSARPWEVRSVRPDGTGDRLMFRAFNIRLHSFSASGDLLATFEPTSPDPYPETWLVSRDGKHRRLLEHHGYFGVSEALSPDGTELAAGFGSGLMIESLRGRVIRTLQSTPSGGSSLSVTFVPSSWSSRNEILFVKNYFINSPDDPCASAPPDRLLAVTASGGRPRLLTRGVGAAQWAPNGNAVVYVRRHRPDLTVARPADALCPPGPPMVSDIYTADSLGKHERRLTTHGAISPTWSPRGTRLAFEGNGPGLPAGDPCKVFQCIGDAIYIVGRHGGRTRLLVPNGTAPLWQPAP